MQYIRGKKEESCIFCFDPEEDQARHVLRRTSRAFVMLNKYPYTNGHILVVPKTHTAQIQTLTQDDYHALTRLLRESMLALENALSPHGMNVGLNLGNVAGAGIDSHLHFHIVPRWSGDHNYMAVCSEVRMINQHLDETYQELLPAFEAIDSR